MTMTDAERAQLLDMYRDRVAGTDATTPGYRDRWLAWCRTLLAHGGTLVTPPPGGEVHLDEFLSLGDRLFVRDGDDLRMWPGEPSGCHANTAALWAGGHITEVVTGYALSDDGLWRQHSWGLTEDDDLVETTVARIRYVGWLLDPSETVRFVLANNEPAVFPVLHSGSVRAGQLLELFEQLIDG